MKASINRFFTYNSRNDWWLLAIGTVAAIIAGILIPSISLIMGTIAGAFGDEGLDPSKMTEEIAKTTKIVGFIAVGIFLFAYIFFAFWAHLAENLTLKLRSAYLRALLRQEVGFFEQRHIE